MISRRSLLRFLGLAPAIAVVPLVLPEDSLTKTWRALLDSGMFGNFPGFSMDKTKQRPYRWVAAPGTEIIWPKLKEKDNG